MENEYYGLASTPTEDYLAHYGIKGMKWGVRRALASRHSDRALARQYKKASRKLEKLSQRADVETQSKRAKRYGRAAAITGSMGLAGAGLTIPTTNKIKSLNKAHGNLQNLKRENLLSELREQKEALNLLGTSDYKKTADAISQRHKNIAAGLDKNIAKNRSAAVGARQQQLGSAALGVAGLVASAATGAKALAAKRRTTKKGHAKAVAKRDAWANEMAKVFSNTKYAKRG